MKKKIFLTFLMISMIFSLVTSFPFGLTKTVSSKDNKTGAEEYVPPVQEEGKINLNGFYTVGNDGALMANLEWTYPYTNPLTGEGVDPGRPYKYRMWQSKKNADGSWT